MHWTPHLSAFAATFSRTVHKLANRIIFLSPEKKGLVAWIDLC